MSSQPIRIVHLVRALDYGGLEKVVLDLARLTDPRRFHVSVLCMGGIGALKQQFVGAQIPVHSLNLDGASMPRLIAAVSRFLRANRTHILHTHNPSPHIVGCIAARLAYGPTVIHTKHGRNYPTNRRKVTLNRLASRFTKVIVAVSEDAARVATQIERVPESKVLTVRNGIDLSKFPPCEAPDSRDHFRVIHVARLLDSVKDQSTLLAAAALVAKACPKFHLDIVGDGPSRASLEALCDALQLRSHITFHGFKDDIHALVTKARLFVLTSLSEGLSITLLEAAASGLPIVATHVGGNPEIVKDGVNGTLVPPKDPEAIANAVLRLLHDEEQSRSYGTAGRQHVEDHFDLKKVVRQYESIYSQALNHVVD